ncbi:hypothetical protein Bca52824_073457 [Brassica carinata]|uniref:Uncharacterized protein n=1 Tax=Brassica carinata TaxID=52824 RepID=A0A8X7QAN0_BRACI|nr:hypothetical protein Bca52824_073457 [Brassica carinata]
MPGGWSLDAERVWFRLVRSDFRHGGGSAVSSVLLRLVASVLPHSVRWMRGEAVQSGGSDFQSLIFPEMYEVEVSAFWRDHGVLLSERIRAAYTLPPGENRATPIGLADPVRPGKGHRNKRAREKEALPDRPDESSESPGLMVRPVSIAVPVGGARKTPNTSASSVGDRALNDDIDSSTHRCRRRALEDINSVILNSPSLGLPPPLRASGEGTSQADPSAHLPNVQETSSWRLPYDNEVPILENPERLALIWHKIREKGCELPSLRDMRERDAYVRMPITNAKAMEASNEYAALMERRLADFPSKEEVGSHLLTIQQLRGVLEAVRVTEQQREVEIQGLKGKLAAAETEKVSIEGRDTVTRKECNLARRSLAREYDAVLAVVKDKLQKKKKEMVAEIRLQEEISLDVEYGLASVSDPSLSRLKLPEAFGDSVDQD